MLGGMVADTSVRAVEPSEALKLAQQLNQAFVEVAESVSKSVVVVRVASKPRARGGVGNPFDNSPFFDQLPEEYRKFSSANRSSNVRSHRRRRAVHALGGRSSTGRVLGWSIARTG